MTVQLHLRRRARMKRAMLVQEELGTHFKTLSSAKGCSDAGTLIGPSSAVLMNGDVGERGLDEDFGP